MKEGKGNFRRDSSESTSMYYILHIPTGLFISHVNTKVSNNFKAIVIDFRHSSIFFIDEKNNYPLTKKIPNYIVKSILTKHSMYLRLLNTMESYIYSEENSKINRIKRDSIVVTIEEFEFIKLEE